MNYLSDGIISKYNNPSIWGEQVKIDWEHLEFNVPMSYIIVYT